MVDGAAARVPPVVAGKYRLRGEGVRDRLGLWHVPAEHAAIQRAVELVYPGSDLAADAPETRRLVAQARTLGGARDPHLQSVLDTGTLPDGRPYVVFEALGGRTIGDLLREVGGPVVPARAGRIVLQVLEALRALHRARVVLRGLSPESVLVTTRAGEDLVKVRDLHSAHSLEAEGAPPDVPFSPYLAPELRRERGSLDPSIDVYSAGALLHHLLTGKTASTSLDAIPDTARRALERSMTEAVDERFPTMDVFMQAVALLAPTDDRMARDDMPLPDDPLVADLHYLLLRRSTRHGTRAAAGTGHARAHLVPVLLTIEAIFKLGGQEAWDQILAQVPEIEGLLPGAGNTPEHLHFGVPVVTYARLLQVADDVLGEGDLGLIPSVADSIAARGLRRLVPELPEPPRTDALIDGFPYLWSRVQLQGTPIVAEREERSARLMVRGQSEPSLEVTSLVAAMLRAGLRSAVGAHAEASVTAAQALGDACDVIRVRW